MAERALSEPRVVASAIGDAICGTAANIRMSGQVPCQAAVVPLPGGEPKRCGEPGCKKFPTYNLEGSEHGNFCARHKQPGMVDVKNKRCAHAGGCKKWPSFNVPGAKSGIVCGSHRLEGMVDVRSKKCEHPGCTRQPKFNIPSDRTGRFCSHHKEAGMVDVKNSRCGDIIERFFGKGRNAPRVDRAQA